MAKLAEAECGSSPMLSDNLERNLQPFFVLHRHPKTGRKTDVSQNQTPYVSQCDGKTVLDMDNSHINSLRIDAFNSVWSKIDTTIKDVLRDINRSIFNEVNSWVHESFKAIRSCGEPDFLEATRSYPIATDALFNQLSVRNNSMLCDFPENIEFVDDQLTFEDLGIHLRSHGCHVANLSSLEFSAKNGIGGCLTCLLRQFLKVTLDVADLSVLASWYNEQRDYKPVVIVIEDMERCCGSILSDFILMLSEWVIKIPIILVFGVATTLDAPRNILTSNALERLHCSKFMLGSPVQRMDTIVEAVLLRPCSWFSVGHKVALFMRDYFLKHDGTLMSFIRALKIACVQHFYSEPLSFLLKDLELEEDLEMWFESDAFKRDMLVKHSSQLRSCQRVETTSEALLKALIELKRLYRHWATVVKCINEVVRPQKIRLLDLYCEALDPHLQKSKTCSDQELPSNEGCYGEHSGAPMRVSVSQAVRNARDLQPKELSELLKRWDLLADGISEIQKKVRELQSMMKSVDGKSPGRRHSSRGIVTSKDPKVSNEKVVALVEWMIRDHMIPIEGLPLHEIFCFKKVDRLQIALLGDPRKKIQADLLEFHKYLCCSCCNNRDKGLLPSFHDTSLMYILVQEHGDVINIHDLYQSFKLTVSSPPAKLKSKSRNSPLPKKRKNVDTPHSLSEAAIQARFCMAISELQITGLLRMPSKRRPDYLQRVAFGS